MDRNIASEEAKRWLGTAEKLLAARDLLGAKSFAIRVREAYPRLLDSSAADDVVAVADTLLAGELRINNQPDWYAILQLPRYTNNLELVATQYRRLALLLNPHRNRLPHSDDAFRLITEAWSVLSNPSKKVFYDNELNMFARFEFGAGSTQLHERQFLQRNQHYIQQNQNLNQNLNQNQIHFPPTPTPPPQQQQQQQQHQQQQFPQPPQFQPLPQQQQQTGRNSPRSKEINEERPNLNNVAESTRSARPIESTPPRQTPEKTTPQTRPAESILISRAADTSTRTSGQVEHDGESFWTACPYCYILYEYPKVYEDCVLRCQKCKRAFHAAVIPSPPLSGKEETYYFCCWGFFPLGGFPRNGKNSGGWTPFSPMFACPIQDQGTKGGGGKGKRNDGPSSPRFIYRDDDVFVEISDESDESDCDWRISRRSTKKARTSKGKSYTAKTTKAATTTTTERVTRSSQSGGGHVNNAGGGDNLDGAAASKGPSKGDMSRKAKAVASGGKKKGAAEWGKLDLNVEFSNDVEEPAAAGPGMNKGNGAGNGEEDNIEGIGFFEGLDEFLSSLPILNVVGDDKVKAT
ncbi:Chaperone protein DnaJ [Morus notabilis]|uniref:Chaperone protein DnaJ n=1 Tax=Morus notabilis TaxID=981085 RepID=W9QX81_9ROSA|nr:uncharacterized protein LOC21394640 [Morus notabilis]EXB57292.1 Chaperone protein DnaJ [Morus notabilis]